MTRSPSRCPEPYPPRPTRTSQAKPVAGVVTMPSVLIERLSQHVDRYAEAGDDGYVFTGEKGRPLSPLTLQTAWDRARHRLDLEHLHFHDLRHLAGTLAASTGAGTKELMYRLGHAAPQAALRYQHATRERDVSIADAIGAILETRLATGPPH